MGSDHSAPTALLQHRADASIRNTDGKTALDLAEPMAALVLSGEYKKNELLQAARSALQCSTALAETVYSLV